MEGIKKCLRHFMKNLRFFVNLCPSDDGISYKVKIPAKIRVYWHGIFTGFSLFRINLQKRKILRMARFKPLSGEKGKLQRDGMLFSERSAAVRKDIRTDGFL